MPAKIKTIKFGLSEGNNYRCLQVTDNLDYEPNSYYSKKEVDLLCQSQFWKVTIVSDTGK